MSNSLATRADAQRVVTDLFAPLRPAYERGGARVSLGETGTPYDLAAAELEAFARPLWGVAPLAAGGGSFPHWDLFRRGLVEGTDPRHPGYWGALGETDPPMAHTNQRMVEMSAIGFALAVVPDEFWEPLSAAERRRLLDWLEPINRHPLVRNNWQFFRMLVNLGFARVGGPFDADAVAESLAEIDRHWLGDGWYSDGQTPGNVDHYIGWAYHYYGLIWAALDGGDAARARRFRARASRFAADYELWFDASGRVIPYGRSLSYRFATAAVWGALAFAGERALPWDTVRGLWTRHLRWWGEQPIARPDGVLSVGYRYGHPSLGEHYNSPGSPYWAMKAFLPLALGDDHPFWQAELAAAAPEPGGAELRPAVMLVSRDEQQSQLLNGGRGLWFVQNGAAKYGKFAYSSAFAFSVMADDEFFADVSDSALVLRDAEGVRRVRASVLASGIDDGVVWSRWQPFSDVEVLTVLAGQAPWHVRLHRVTTGRDLVAIEAGFAVGWHGGPPDDTAVRRETGPGVALVSTRAGTSVIADPEHNRKGSVRALQPNTNLMAPRALVPALRTGLPPGTHTLTCQVSAIEPPGTLLVADLPAIPRRAWEVLAAHAERAQPTSGPEIAQ